MLSKKISIILALAIVAAMNSTAIAGKPLKIFILSGQSNMQGKARVSTIERLNMTEDSKQMYKDMKVKDGLPSAVKDVYGVYFTSGRQGPVVLKGPLRPGYEGEITPKGSSFGPEYTFSIYMPIIRWWSLLVQSWQIPAPTTQPTTRMMATRLRALSGFKATMI